MSVQITSLIDIKKSISGNYPANFQRYADQVKEDDLWTAFRNQMPAAEIFFRSISEELSKRKYAEDKWTIREVLQHIIDAERIFAYRASTKPRVNVTRNLEPRREPSLRM